MTPSLLPASAPPVMVDLPVPPGYVELFQRFGGGSLGHFVSLLTPEQVDQRTDMMRDIADADWFWDREELRPAIVGSGVLVADSFDGDCLFWLPDSGFFCLPRHDDLVHDCGTDFVGAVGWMLSGQLNATDGWTWEGVEGRDEWRSTLTEPLSDVVARVKALDLHDRVDRRDSTAVFFFPAIEGRLQLFQFDGGGGELDVHLRFAGSADPSVVTAAMG